MHVVRTSVLHLLVSSPGGLRPCSFTPCRLKMAASMEARDRQFLARWTIVVKEFPPKEQVSISAV